MSALYRGLIVSGGLAAVACYPITTYMMKEGVMIAGLGVSMKTGGRVSRRNPTSRLRPVGEGSRVVEPGAAHCAPYAQAGVSVPSQNPRFFSRNSSQGM